MKLNRLAYFFTAYMHSHRNWNVERMAYEVGISVDSVKLILNNQLPDPDTCKVVLNWLSNLRPPREFELSHHYIEVL